MCVYVCVRVHMCVYDSSVIASWAIIAKIVFLSAAVNCFGLPIIATFAISLGVQY